MRRAGIALLAVLLALLLCACGARKPAPAPEPAAGAAPPPAEETPESVPEPVELPDGRQVAPDTETLDLSGMNPLRLRRTLPLLARLPALERVELGEESGERSLPAELLRDLVQTYPEVDFDYTFSFYGKEINTLDGKLDLNHIPMDDEGEAVRALLPCLKNCVYLDMDFCGVSSEAMARIRDENPGMEVVWRIWFGTHCTARTDVERIVASVPEYGLTAENTGDLRYCTKVRLLDLGHSEHLGDFGFLAYMPELEVAILGISGLRDLRPLENCTKLEYLEINSCAVRDLAPLAGLTNLKHLNCCWLFEVKNWEALCGLKQLERLWIGACTVIPDEGKELLRQSLPDTLIDFREQSGCGGTWRTEYGVGRASRYELLRRQFDYDNYARVLATPWNDPLYEPHPDG